MVSLLSLRFKRHSIGIVAALYIPFWALANGLKHIAMTLVFNSYSPGALVAAGLYVPLSVLMLDRAVREDLLSARRVVLAAALGFGVQFGVLALGHFVG